MNKLDGKCIVDRDLLEYFGEILSEIYGPRRDAINSALATDLTGWAAVPVLSTIQMDVAGSDEMLGDEFAGLDSDVAAKVWNAMLNASPPLPGGGK